MKTEAAYLYNPKNQSEQELIEGFVIRQKQFKIMFDTINNDLMLKPCQHYIVQGLRGTGKTTLLMRLYYELMRTEKLTTWLIPVMFNEEQYGISRLYKLWYNVALELENKYADYSELVIQLEELDDLEKIEEESCTLLFEALQKNKCKIILFIDNIGDVLKKFSKKELQRFREVLITNNNIRIIGGSSVVLESTYDYKQPFFEFFKIINLKELNKTETIDLLLKVDEGKKDHTIQEIIDKHPGRIDALRILTGGIPRTIVMLYEIFINDRNGDSFRDLEILLDKVTPLYKHRMDNLPTQQQEIMDVIALNWDAIPVKQIARVTKMESKAISAQLRVLLKNDLIIKKETSTKNHLYQVKERFFNIWYIMRNGRRSDRNKVKWLTKFIEVWCSANDVDNMAKSFIEKIRTGNIYDKYVYHLSEAYAQKVRSPILQEELLTEIKIYLEKCRSEYSCEVSESDMNFIRKQVNPLIDNRKFSQAISTLQSRESQTGIIEYFRGSFYYLFEKDLKKSIAEFKISAKKGERMSLNEIGKIYNELKNYKLAEKYFLKAINSGHNGSLSDLAKLYQFDLKDYEEAEKYYLKAVEKKDKDAFIHLAIFYSDIKEDYNLAIKYFEEATKLGDDDFKSKAFYYLGVLFLSDLKNFDSSETNLLIAIKLGNVKAVNTLLILYIIYSQKEKAIEASKKYIAEEADIPLKLSIIFILIWIGNTNEAISILDNLFSKGQFLDVIESNLILMVINLLLAKNQYNFVLQLFQNETLKLKDRFKPTYYVLMHFMRDKFPDEILKMGSELEEPVQKIIKEIEMMAIKYA